LALGLLLGAEEKQKERAVGSSMCIRCQAVASEMGKQGKQPVRGIATYKTRANPGT
jgi:hypothetical protein